MKNLLILGFLTMFLFTDCIAFNRKVKGSGTVTTEKREVSPFDRIEIDGVFKVFLSQGDNESAEVEIDDNLQQYVVLKNEGRKLVLEIKDDINFSKTTKNNVYITVKNINELDIEGVCTVETQTPLKCADFSLEVNGVTNGNFEIYCDKLNADLDGVGNIKLRGEATELTVKKDGVGSFNSENMKAVKVNIRNSGVGSASVYASEELSMKNSGVGSITYSGDAVIKDLDSDGIGKIKKAK